MTTATKEAPAQLTQADLDTIERYRDILAQIENLSEDFNDWREALPEKDGVRATTLSRFLKALKKEIDEKTIRGAQQMPKGKERDLLLDEVQALVMVVDRFWAEPDRVGASLQSARHAKASMESDMITRSILEAAGYELEHRIEVVEALPEWPEGGSVLFTFTDPSQIGLDADEMKALGIRRKKDGRYEAPVNDVVKAFAKVNEDLIEAFEFLAL